MAQTIGNTDDIIDSRDVIARIEELENDLRAEYDAISEDHEARQDAFPDWLQNVAEDDTHTLQDAAQELRALQSLADDADGCADWRYGETLIRDSYFVTYAQELAEDCGMLNKNAEWPNSYINWDAAAEALQQDYTSVDFDGVTYWIRS